MKRRHFTAQVTATAFGLTVLGAARAQGGPVTDKQYTKINPPVPLPSTPGKVDVIEFFSYACPHCFEFEAPLEAWLKRLPANVNFHRVPVAFLFNAENFQKLYYTLETLGQVDALQAKIFNAIHVERVKMTTPQDIAAFVAKNGVDPTKFLSIFNSFSMGVKMNKGHEMIAAFGVDSIPNLGIQGRYLTSPGTAGGPEQAFKVTDTLIQQVASGH